MNALPSDPSLATSLPLHVLVVDDTATNRQILSVFLKKFGHRVDLAVDGAQAVEMFGANHYDLVVMDVMMPVMDGYEATRRIKAACGDRWVPVIFLSALDKDENLVNGLEAGGDDYLSKPVNFVVLEAKLRSLSRSIALRRELEDARRSLQGYYDEREAENRLAEGVLNRMLHRPGLTDPSLRYWMHSATNFSGDIVAATRTDDGRFYALLADATGHGLGAAISVLPVLTLFYDMARAGLPLGRIVAKLNSQLREVLPVGRFVACGCLCVDPTQNCFEVWMGGIPAALLLDANGAVVGEVESQHLALGIAEQDWMTASPERFDLPASGGQILLYSDGLVEASNAAGDEFGETRLRAALVSPAATRLDAVQAALGAHLGGLAPHDDATLMLIDLPAPAAH